MPLPRWLARLNRGVTNRVMGVLAPRLPGFGIVVHRGRRSGRLYRTPVNVFRHGDRYVIALTYGPDGDWIKNVLAAGGCEIETRGRRVRLTHPHVYRDEHRQAVPALVRLALGILDVSYFMALTAAPAE